MAKRPRGVTAGAILVTLQIARHEIEKDNQIYICTSLPYSDAGWYLRSYISKALGNHPYLKGWLIHEHTASINLDLRSMKRYRLQ